MKIFLCKRRNEIFPTYDILSTGIKYFKVVLGNAQRILIILFYIKLLVIQRYLTQKVLLTFQQACMHKFYNKSDISQIILKYGTKTVWKSLVFLNSTLPFRSKLVSAISNVILSLFSNIRHSLEAVESRYIN